MSTSVPAGKVTTWPRGIWMASQSRVNLRSALSMVGRGARKPENNGIPINFAWLERDGREFRMVGGVGEMLRFQTKTGAPVIDLSAFALDCSVKKIAGV